MVFVIPSGSILTNYQVQVRKCCFDVESRWFMLHNSTMYLLTVAGGSHMIFVILFGYKQEILHAHTIHYDVQ